MPILTLIGYRGTGKSTVARLLADRLAVPWTVVDIAQAPSGVAQLWTSKG